MTAVPGIATLSPGYAVNATLSPGYAINAATHGLVSHGEREETRG